MEIKTMEVKFGRTVGTGKKFEFVRADGGLVADIHPGEGINIAFDKLWDKVVLKVDERIRKEGENCESSNLRD